MPRLIVRRFIQGVLQSEETLEYDSEDDVCMRQVEAQVGFLADHSGMVELEFPDDPVEERFFRFGTDPTGMAIPIAVKLDDMEEK